MRWGGRRGDSWDSCLTVHKGYTEQASNDVVVDAFTKLNLD